MANESNKKLTIKFKADGDKRLIAAINKLAKAQSQLTKKNLQAAQAQKKQRHRVEANNKALKTQADLLRKAQGFIANYRNRLLLAAFAVNLVNKALLSFVKVAGVQEDSVRRLADVFGGSAAQSLDEYSSKLQQISVFGDETINNVMAQIGAFGANEEQAKKLTRATLDLASGLNLDLNTAGLLIAKTFGSTTNALIRYGVSVDAQASQAEKQKAIIDAVRAKWGGLSKVLAETTSGQLAQASNAWGDFLENIGMLITPIVLAATKAFKALSEALTLENLKIITFVVLPSLLIALKGQAAQIAINTLLTGGYSAAILAANTAVLKLTASMLKNPYLAVGAALLVVLPLLAKATGLFADNQKEIDANGRASQAAAEQAAKLAEKEAESIATLEKKLKILSASNDLEKFAIEQGRKLTLEEINLHNAIKVKNEELSKEKQILDFVGKIRKESLVDRRESLKIQLSEIQVLARKKSIELASAIASKKTFDENKKALENNLQREEEAFEVRKNIAASAGRTLNAIRKEYRDKGITDTEDFSKADKARYDKLFALLDENQRKNTEQAPVIAKLSTELAMMGDSAEENVSKIKAQLEALEIGEEDIQKIINGVNNDIAKQGEEISKLTSKAEAGFNTMKGFADSFSGAFSGLYSGLGFNLIGTFQNVTGSFQKEQNRQLEAAKEAAAARGVILEGEALAEAEQQATRQGAQAAAMEMGAQMTQMVISNAMAEKEAKMQAIKDAANLEIDQLRLTRKFQKASDKEKKKMEKEVRDAANKQLLKEFESKQDMARAGVIMDTASAIMKLQVNPGFPAGIPLAVMAGVMGAVQLSQINAQKPPKMALGGLVGGLPHGLGGTLIEAERGEFVMNKKAVESVGLENMNKINSGNLGGNPVNVSFSGNINSDDFIESEAIPKIKEAIRRGADIGVG